MHRLVRFYSDAKPVNKTLLDYVRKTKYFRYPNELQVHETNHLHDLIVFRLLPAD